MPSSTSVRRTRQPSERVKKVKKGLEDENVTCVTKIKRKTNKKNVI